MKTPQKKATSKKGLKKASTEKKSSAKKVVAKAAQVPSKSKTAQLPARRQKAAVAADTDSAPPPGDTRSAAPVELLRPNARKTVFVRLTPDQPAPGDFELKVFFDKEGSDEMINDRPLELLGDGTGKIEFRFIKAASVEEPVTADLVIIGQTIVDPDAPRQQRRASPFQSQYDTGNKYYPIYYLPSPASEADPLNLGCHVKHGGDGTILGGTLNVIQVPDGQPSLPYKYTIVALCDGATKVANIDPTVILNPN